MRKNHRNTVIPGLKKGDLFDVVLIPSKGGSAAKPSPDDLIRLRAVGNYYHAKAIVLSAWKKGREAELFVLEDKDWKGPVDPVSIFE